jgi:hypothetical protein
MPQGKGGSFQFGLNALAAYLVITLAAWAFDRAPARKGSRRR